MRPTKTNNAKRDNRFENSSKAAGTLIGTLLLTQALFTSHVFAASESTEPQSATPSATTSTSEVIQRDGKYYLYQNGKSLNATGYDDLEIEQHDNFPDLAEARLGSHTDCWTRKRAQSCCRSRIKALKPARSTPSA